MATRFHAGCLLCFCLVAGMLLGGCAGGGPGIAAPSRVETTAPAVKPAVPAGTRVPAAAQERQQYVSARTEAVRKLPVSYSPGKPLTVTVSVTPLPAAAGIIVSEDIPAGWRMVGATPQWIKAAGSSFEWLRYGMTVPPFTITYTVEPGSDVRGTQVFSGRVQTHEEGRIQTQGDTAVSPR